MEDYKWVWKRFAHSKKFLKNTLSGAEMSVYRKSDWFKQNVNSN